MGFVFGALSLRAYAAGVWVCKGGKWEIEGEGEGRGAVCMWVWWAVRALRVCVRACVQSRSHLVRARARTLSRVCG